MSAKSNVKSNYKDVIAQARKSESKGESQQTLKPESQQTSKPDNNDRAGAREEEVNLSIKVPKRLRRHWVAEAKRQDTTLTAVIMEALNSRFGEPETA